MTTYRFASQSSGPPPGAGGATDLLIRDTVVGKDLQVRIKSVRITNFRCLQDVRVVLDSLTSFVGPNGAGKSTVLRALDWFFNGGQNLTEEDVYSGATENRRISVEVNFTELTDSDRSKLGPTYAPPGSTTFTAWRFWDEGTDKMTARARSFPPFEEVRGAQGLKEKRPLWDKLAAEQPDLGLPRWTTIGASDQVMTTWEQENPERLEETEGAVTHLFGFNGQHLLSGLFDYVLVTADLRANEESVEGKKTIIGRILERAINREGANAAFEALAFEVGERQAAINEEYLGDQLKDLADELTAEVSSFAAGRGIRLHPRTPDVRPSPASISVAISDALSETSVDRQGHGFQRALLISSLKLLAARGAQARDGSVICLAIEEPELFQHPTQARVFSKVLRELSCDAAGGLQVVYATHSPYFIEPRFFDQVRRVTRRQSAPTAHPSVDIYNASIAKVITRLEGHQDDRAVLSRWDQVCTRNLAEAFFAEAVVIVEGDTDRGVLDGMSRRTGQRQFEADGITIAEAWGKTLIYTPHAILAELGIPTLVIFDNDSGCADRIRAKIASGGTGNPEAEEIKIIRENRELLRYLGESEVDYPVGAIGKTAFAWDDTLEHVISVHWAGWDKKRKEIVDGGLGVEGKSGKHAATFELTSEQCAEEPMGALLDAVGAIRALVSS